MRRSAPGFRAYRGARQLLALVLPALALMLAARPSHAVEYTQVKTVEGCKVVEVRGYAAAYQQISWSGSCRNGGRRHGKTGSHLEGRTRQHRLGNAAGRQAAVRNVGRLQLPGKRQDVHPFQASGAAGRQDHRGRMPGRAGCWTIAKARGQTNGTSAPKPPAPRFPEQRWRYRPAPRQWASSSGLKTGRKSDDRRHGRPVRDQRSGPVSRGGIAGVAHGSGKGGRSIFLETRDSRSSAKRRRACRSTTSGMNSRPATSRQCCAPPQPEHAASQEELPADAMRCPQPRSV